MVSLRRQSQLHLAFHGILWRRVARLALLLFAFSACSTNVAIPDDSASPDVVLDAYLSALAAGDCSTGARLAVEDGNVLCGHVDVASYGILGHPSRIGPDRLIYVTTLLTAGSDDDRVGPGTATWFFSLDKQSSGAWRVAAVGSGP